MRFGTCWFLTGRAGPAPEVIYGRRKMTVWLRRNGFPEASKYTKRT
jgi:putative transposase